LAEQSSSKAFAGEAFDDGLGTRMSTDIIPFNEYGDLDDLDFCNTSRVRSRIPRQPAPPELDDCHHTDDLIPLPLCCAVGSFRSHAG